MLLQYPARLSVLKLICQVTRSKQTVSLPSGHYSLQQMLASYYLSFLLRYCMLQPYSDPSSALKVRPHVLQIASRQVRYRTVINFLGKACLSISFNVISPQLYDIATIPRLPAVC